MAAISKELASSLDRLSERIAEAEEYLSKLPQTVEYVVVSERAYTEDESSFSETTRLIYDGGRLLSGVVVEQAESGMETESTDCVLLANLPIRKRLACAEQIPKFIERSEKELDSLPKEIDEVCNDIEHAMS